jgi:nitrite reductase/ring-hydroxylating ferredoxin subunit
VTQAQQPDRRTFLSTASSWLMLGGLAGGYGACAAMGGRYLFPARGRELRWQYVAPLSELCAGAALDYRAPSGERVTIARRGEAGTVDDFIALSSTCPHLGCQVHWEAHKSRFFCPCHNGVFTPEGVAVSGPPAEAGQSLPRYALKVEDGLLFIQVPVESLA